MIKSIGLTDVIFWFIPALFIGIISTAIISGSFGNPLAELIGVVFALGAISLAAVPFYPANSKFFLSQAIPLVLWLIPTIYITFKMLTSFSGLLEFSIPFLFWVCFGGVILGNVLSVRRRSRKASLRKEASTRFSQKWQQQLHEERASRFEQFQQSYTVHSDARSTAGNSNSQRQQDNNSQSRSESANQSEKQISYKTFLANQRYFESLGLKPGACKEEIKEAYFELVKQYHPDKLPEGATPAVRKLLDDKMKELNEAYRVLMSI